MITELGNPETQQKNETTQVKSNERCYLNFGEEDEMEIVGFKINSVKQYFTYAAYIITIGFLRLLYHWFPQWQLYSTHTQCPLGEAKKVLIIDNYKNKYKTYFVKNVEKLKAGREVLERIEDNQLSKKNQTKENLLLNVHLSDGSQKFLKEARTIRCKKVIYVWDEQKYKFIRLSGMDRGLTTNEFHKQKGFSYEEQQLRRIIYGTNEIAIPVQSIFTLVVLETLTPFYIFQVFSLFVWLAEFYYYYTIAIIFMSVFGIATSVLQTRKNQKNLKGTVQMIDNVKVSRGNHVFEEIPTTDLVPGDVIIIPIHGGVMSCDAVLLNGNVVVNESMLTGESVPITKTALPNNGNLYDLVEHKEHTLFCGTKIIQTRNYLGNNVVAVVTRTGYLTSKGQLVRSIMYPPPADFKFDQDSYKFILILAFIAMCGFFYTVVYKFSRNASTFDIIIKALDLITIAIPPALPAAMTVGKLYALNRLKKHRIFCINSRVINVSGSIDCICFDKTGTLTEDGLDLWGVLPIENVQITTPIKSNYIKENAKHTRLFKGMITCHSLTLIDEELCGDPLDVKMFESTGWILEESVNFDTSKFELLVPVIFRESIQNMASVPEIGLVQQYQFSSTLQRMSVVCREVGNPYFEVFVKGSPEMIVSLSRPETVPKHIWNKLKEYTEKGYRVIGMGTKTLYDVPFDKIKELSREDVETELDFIGLIVLENKLKPQTKSAINALSEAGMKIVMITGDNIQTALSVARECNIIKFDISTFDVTVTKPTINNSPKIFFTEVGKTNNREKLIFKDLEAFPERKYQFVVSGAAWADINEHFHSIVPRIVTRGVVFARMSASQKQHLIEELQELGYYVAMCGDGANDCGALKAANVGISLSEAESSIASPFTSQETNISCTIKVIKEGRAALTTSFGVFKFMLCYSLTEFTSCILLYTIDSNLTSMEFLFIDICLVLNFATSFGNAKAYNNLHNQPPMTSLLSFVPLTSITLFMLTIIVSQIAAFYVMQMFSWFTPFIRNPQNTTYYTSYENYGVFSVSMFQYIIMAVTFSKAKPYRKSIFTNYIFFFSLLLMTIVCSYITLDPAKWIVDVLELKVPPAYDGRVACIIIALITFFVCIFVEEVLVEFILRKKILKKIRPLDLSKQYAAIEEELKYNETWPVIETDSDVKDLIETSLTRQYGVVNSSYED